MIKLISGGAEGSDNVFTTCALNNNIPADIHSFESHRITLPNSKNMANLILHSGEELKEALPHLKKANIVLQRKIPANKYIRNLLCRNYFQINNTNCVIAVGYYNSETHTVEGGTGWAVQMALQLLLPVYVFDLSNATWLYSLMAIDKAPDIRSYDNITGIGTRNLPSRGADEIKKLFEVLK